MGPRTLKERRTDVVLAPGVIWTHIVRGRPSRGGPWRVDVLQVGPGRGSEGRALERPRPRARDGERDGAPDGGAGRRERRLLRLEGVFDGDPIGVLALGGQLVSEPVACRAALLLPRAGTARGTAAALRRLA